MRLSDWLTLFRLGRQRHTSKEAYASLQAFQGELILSEIETRGIRLENKRILDLGCGYGGYSLALAKRTNRIMAIDRYIALTFQTSDSIHAIRADALSLPFGDQQFDFVMCASLIEHVPHPLCLLQEIRRVLSSQGICYLSFPPFYSPVGGHQFKPYHLLGEKLAIRLSGLPVTGYATLAGEWGLYPLTIRRVRRLIVQAGLTIQHMSTRYLPVNLASLPVVGEFLTWHVQFLLS